MAKVTNYQCPACTGPLHFSGTSGKLECDYCGSSFDISEIDAEYGKKVEDAKAEAESEKEKLDEKNAKLSSEERQWKDEEVQMYNCSTCGAQIICEENTVATSCPYCGNPTVIPGQFTAGLMPEKVIPFKIDKKGAENALKQFYKGKSLLPKVFSAENHIEEIKGVYVPFWLFDGTVDAEVSLSCTKVYSRIEGQFRVTETDFYNVRRCGTVPFSKVPADASKKMDNAQMDSIEPFDYSGLVDFSTSYLPGFYAEAYDEDKDTVFPRIKTRVENSAVSEMISDVSGYDGTSVTSQKTNIRDLKTHYAFLPVWLLNTKWKGKDFRFAVNGQTGKVVGNLPISAGRFCGWLFGITAVCTAVFTGLLYFIANYLQ